MKIPYHCPYCDQVSMRKWNISTHMQRKHKGRDNPFKMSKEILTDRLNQAQNSYDFSNSYWPHINYSDTVEVAERLNYINNLLKELRKLSTAELGGIMREIRNFPQFKIT